MLPIGWSELIKILVSNVEMLWDDVSVSKIASKCHHKNLFNTEFAWHEKSLSEADTISIVHHVIDKDIFRELISKLESAKVAGFVSEIVKSAGEAGLDILKSPVNHTIVVQRVNT